MKRLVLTQFGTYLGSLVADGSLSVPIEATYRLDDYRRALEHADAPKRGGKVLSPSMNASRPPTRSATTMSVFRQ
jgi:hypothetical protein